ncbi:hypothetical protein B4U79_15938, partial [Dinothrombium tinctorium]
SQTKAALCIKIESLNSENSIDSTSELKEYINSNNIESINGLDEKLINIGEGINNEMKKQIIDLLNKYKCCFTNKLSNITPTDVAEINIETIGPPVKKKMYRLPLVHRKPLKQILDELLAANVIRPSTSSYCAPVLLVPKKNGEYRLVVDYRDLNPKIINENSYPIQRIEDILDSINGCSTFSLLDCHSGFFTLPIAESDKHKTAIITPFGLFEFNRLPQGLKISPNNFQMVMEKVYEKVLNDCAKVYQDDCLVHSKNSQIHFSHLERSLECVKQAKLKLRLNKCEFFKNKIIFLGHVVSKDGLEISENRVKAIIESRDPQNITEVKSFLGLLNYFKDHIKDLSIIAEPLINLTRKNVKFEFNEDAKLALDELKRRICTAPILSFFNENLKTELHTDGSRNGVGAALIQIDNNGSEKIISYYSRTLRNAEKNYSAIEIELLAIVSAIKRFHHYLLGHEFEIKTDSNSLTYLSRTKDINSRLSRWSLFLQHYNFKVSYRRGESNKLCDFLSRFPSKNEELNKTENRDIFILNDSNFVYMKEYNVALDDEFENFI